MATDIENTILEIVESASTTDVEAPVSGLAEKEAVKTEEKTVVETEDDERLAELFEAAPEEDIEGLPANARKKIDREVGRRKASEEKTRHQEELLQARDAEIARLKASKSVDMDLDDDADLDARLDKRLNEREAKRAQERRIEAENAKLAKLADAASKSADAYRKIRPDYDDVVGSLDFGRRDDIMIELASSKNIAQLSYFYGQPENHDQFEALKSMSHSQVIRKIAELDTRMSEAARKKKVSKTPATLEISGSNGATSVHKDLENMSFKEFEEAMKKRKRRG